MEVVIILSVCVSVHPAAVIIENFMCIRERFQTIPLVEENMNEHTIFFIRSTSRLGIVASSILGRVVEFPFSRDDRWIRAKYRPRYRHATPCTFKFMESHRIYEVVDFDIILIMFFLHFFLSFFKKIFRIRNTISNRLINFISTTCYQFIDMA